VYVVLYPRATDLSAGQCFPQSTAKHKGALTCGQVSGTVTRYSLTETALMRIAMHKASAQCQEEDPDVKADGPVADIEEVVLDAFFD